MIALEKSRKWPRCPTVKCVPSRSKRRLMAPQEKWLSLDTFVGGEEGVCCFTQGGYFL